MADEKVVKGGEVVFEGSTPIRPDASPLEATVTSPQPATSPLVIKVLRQYVRDVATFFESLGWSAYSPEIAETTLPYFLAFDSSMYITAKPVDKQSLLEILRTRPETANLLDVTDLAESLPECYDLKKGDPFVDGLMGNRPFKEYALLESAVQGKLIIPVRFLPLLIKEGEKYAKLLEKATFPVADPTKRGQEAIYLHVGSSSATNLAPRFEKLGLSLENLQRLTEEQGIREVYEMIQELRTLHEGVGLHWDKRKITADLIYARLKRYHPELTV